jgi:hypothetical protein
MSCALSVMVIEIAADGLLKLARVAECATASTLVR